MLIDGFISIANVLCGIEPIRVGKEETDFLSYILFNEQVSFAFKSAILLGVIVVVFATIFQSSEKIALKTFAVCKKCRKFAAHFA